MPAGAGEAGAAGATVSPAAPVPADATAPAGVCAVDALSPLSRQAVRLTASATATSAVTSPLTAGP